jgi:hypothetical protein
MTSAGRDDLVVSAADSDRFARLSGDFNPLHVDAVAARRTQFGSTVVHGIHLVLATLDRIFASRGAEGLTPAALSATFSNPVRTGSAVHTRSTVDADGKRIRFSGESEDRPAFSGSVELIPAPPSPPWRPSDCEFGTSTPRAQTFPPSTSTGAVALAAHPVHFARLFPALARGNHRDWAADLLATTRIVGMECPGMDSIYSGYRLRRVADAGGAARESMTWRVEKADERFRLIRVALTGGVLEGTLEALFRPQPVAQPRLADLVAKVAAQTFSHQRALVVGGSRGLGELTAKILAAGDADVTITYAKGAADAERVCAEARTLGRACTAKPLDVAVARADELPEWLATTGFTHVYFFASPPIARNPTGRWNHVLFEQFAHVYVRAFGHLAEKMLAATAKEGRATRFLYPSTVFADTPERGFAEYGVAKAAGEALCRQLQQQYGTPFAAPRLPRMRTDQTSGVADSGVQDAFPVMHALLRDFGA